MTLTHRSLPSSLKRSLFVGLAALTLGACDPADGEPLDDELTEDVRDGALALEPRPAEPIGPAEFFPGLAPQVSDYDFAVEAGEIAAGASGDLTSASAAAFPGSLPIHIQRYGPFGNGGILDTGFPTSEWAAAVVGLQTVNGDIQENGTGNPLFAYPYQFNGTWHVTFDLRSHQTHEGWTIWVMFVNRDMATTSNY